MNRPIYYIPVHGTWAIDEDHTAWWKSTGPFALYSKRFNVVQYDKLPPFIWSSDISGFRYNLSSGFAKHTDWKAGGWSLYYYLNQIPLEDRSLICHSHGLQVVLYCLSFGMPIRNLISVCSPIRRDMDPIAEVARLRVQNWLHIYDNNDTFQFLGQFGDGRFFGSRRSAHATVNESLRDINHTDVLKIGGKMDLWNTRGWYGFLRN